MMHLPTLAFAALGILSPGGRGENVNFTARGGIAGDYSGVLRPQVHYSPPIVSDIFSVFD
jgi:hypothetical protein